MFDHPVTRSPATITRGAPHAFMDTLGNVLAVPNKLLFLNADFESHRISPEVEAALVDFTAHHDLAGLQIRLNEYAPMDELRRLIANKRVNIVLRGTLGLLHWFAYTVNVGRVVGGDHYNPYSESVSLYSDHVGIALHEVGHALDFRRRATPGLYALLRYIPGVSLYQEYLASLYAVQFLRSRGQDLEEQRAWRVLFPAYSTYVFGALLDFFPSAAAKISFLPVVAVGHVLGNLFAALRLRQLGQAARARLSLVGQWLGEGRRALRMFSPATRGGREQLGTMGGFLLGTLVGGIGGPVGAWLGFAAARKVGGPDPRESGRQPGG